jgi:heme o synthase
VAILLHTVLLVAFSLVPAFTGLGPTYAVCAAVGGAWFLFCSVRLVLNPTRTNALGNFRASLVQLSLLLIGAIIDGGLNGRLLA